VIKKRTFYGPHPTSGGPASALSSRGVCQEFWNRGGERYGKFRLRFKPALNQFVEEPRETDAGTPRLEKRTPTHADAWVPGE
jgi:hypothetical protein